MSNSEPLPFEVYLTDRAERSLVRLDRQIARRILRKLTTLAENVEVVQHVAMAGRWKGYYRIRIGDYRAIYDLDYNERILIVILIGHRREVYDD
jgi:mRNA interferase RelE/StbE